VTGIWCGLLVSSNASTYPLTGPALGRKGPGLTPRGDYSDPNSPPDGGPTAETCTSHGTRRPPTGQEGQRFLLPVRLRQRGAARTSSSNLFTTYDCHEAERIKSFVYRKRGGEKVKGR
jgi:hypothetical protein